MMFLYYDTGSFIHESLLSLLFLIGVVVWHSLFTDSVAHWTGKQELYDEYAFVSWIGFGYFLIRETTLVSTDALSNLTPIDVYDLNNLTSINQSMTAPDLAVLSTET